MESIDICYNIFYDFEIVFLWYQGSRSSTVQNGLMFFTYGKPLQVEKEPRKREREREREKDHSAHLPILYIGPFTKI